MERTLVGDFPYKEVELEIIYFDKTNIWLKSQDKHTIKMSRPRRFAWLEIKIGMKKQLEVKRIMRPSCKIDQPENYYAYLHVKGECNDTIPYKSTMSSMIK